MVTPILGEFATSNSSQNCISQSVYQGHQIEVLASKSGLSAFGTSHCPSNVEEIILSFFDNSQEKTQAVLAFRQLEARGEILWTETLVYKISSERDLTDLSLQLPKMPYIKNLDLSQSKGINYSQLEELAKLSRYVKNINFAGCRVAAIFIELLLQDPNCSFTTILLESYEEESMGSALSVSDIDRLQSQFPHVTIKEAPQLADNDATTVVIDPRPSADKPHCVVPTEVFNRSQMFNLNTSFRTRVTPAIITEILSEYSKDHWSNRHKHWFETWKWGIVVPLLAKAATPSFSPEAEKLAIAEHIIEFFRNGLCFGVSTSLVHLLANAQNEMDILEIFDESAFKLMMRHQVLNNIHVELEKQNRRNIFYNVEELSRDVLGHELKLTSIEFESKPFPNLEKFQGAFQEGSQRAVIDFDFEENGHAIFIQLVHPFLLFDINTSGYQFSSREELISFCYQHIRSYQPKKKITIAEYGKTI